MSKHKKLLSLLLSAAMTVSCMSGLALTASAAQTEYVNVTFDEAEYTVDTIVAYGNTAATNTYPNVKTVDPITYTLGARNGGDGTTVISIVSENSNQYLALKAGRFTTSGRQPYFSVSGLPEQITDNLSVGFRVKFETAGCNFTLKTADGTVTIAEVNAADAGAAPGVWYNYIYAVNGGAAYSILYADDGTLMSYKTGTAASYVPARFDFNTGTHSGASTPGISTYVDDLLIYTDTADVLSPAIITVYDAANEEGIAGADVKIDNVSFTADDSGSVNLYLPSGTYSVSAEKDGYLPSETAVLDTSVGTADIPLTAITNTVPASIVIGGGTAIVYKPADGGSVSTDAFTAAVYNSDGLELPEAEVVWSVDGSPAGVSVANGVVTVTSDIAVASDAGVDLTVRASSADDASVYSTAVLHVNNTARLASFDIIGNTNIKNGTSTAYTVGNVLDQYNNTYSLPADTAAVFSSDNAGLTFADADATAAFDELSTPTAVTITATIGSVISSKTVNVHDYYLYEPGVGSNDYGLRMETVGTETVIAMPKAANGTATDTITFAAPMTFEANTIKEISFDQTWTVKGTSGQYRRIYLRDGDTTLVDLVYVYDVNFGVGAGAKVDGNYVINNEIGSLGAAGTWTHVNVLVKTNSVGVTTATVSLADAEGTAIGSPVTVELPETASKIDNIQLTQERGTPDDRLLALKNIIAKDSDSTGAVIEGASYITKQYGASVTEVYNVINASPIDGEYFIWDYTISDGGSDVGIYPEETEDNGVSVTVTDEAVAGTVITLIAESSSDSLKKASIDITINDYASVKSFDITGPVVVSATGTAQYTVENIVDEYGDTLSMDPTFEIISGAELASITSEGVLTAGSKAGNITIAVTVGNPGKTMTKNLDIAIGSYYYSSDVNSETSMVFNVSELIGAASASGYKVSLLKNGVVTEEVVAASAGNVTVNTTGASKVEVSPVFKLNLSSTAMDGYVTVNSLFSADAGVGYDSAVPTASASGAVMDNGLVIALADGFYDMSFKKANGSRTDIMLNGHMLGNNVDQYGWGRSSAGALYELKSVKVEGGLAKLYTEGYASGGNIITYVEVSRNADFAERKTHIFIGGDSTVTSYYAINDAADGKTIPWDSASSKQTGWSQVLGNYLTDDVVLVDLAEGGNYAESWITTAFPGVIAQAQPGDYFFVQFGINDRNYGSKSVAGMQAALEEMVDRCVAKGVIPVLISPQNSVSLWGSGTNPNGSGNAGYYDGVIESAVKKGALYIDLDSITSEILGGWGQAYTTANYHTFKTGAVQDTLHLSYQGASLCASIIAGSILTQQQEGTVDAQGNGFDAITVNTGYSYTFTDSEGSEMTFTVYGQTKGSPTKLTVGNFISDSTQVSVDIENHTGADKTATLIVAVRDASGNLAEVSTVEQTFAADEADTLTVKIPSVASGTVYCYVWDTTSSMVPLTDSVVLK